ncbi:hypothetical protein VPNG_08390 [Cytospora leucostoma]|uniref:ubiquitinyl hydrolase 1 n=1 Tax=Cytospora leucostoma TaxID=1230097 RepID=A0A423W644_9PEZI|nr:hypothetical protein VPNG_08390 [Cytospora leucostoma]
MPGRGHGGPPGYPMGGSPVPNPAPGLHVTPASASGPPQRGGRGRGQHFNPHHSPGHFQPYTPYQPAIYNPYANAYNNGFAYASPQYNILPPQYGQNGALPQNYAHAYQQHFYPPPQQFYNTNPIPQYPGPQSPSFSIPYQPPPQSIVSVPPSEVVPFSPGIPPPIPSTPASLHSLQHTPIPMAQPIYQPPELPVAPTFSPRPIIAQETEPAPQSDTHIKTPEAPQVAAPAEPSPAPQDVPSSPEFAPLDPRPETIAHRLPWTTHPDEPWPKSNKPRRKKRVLPKDAQGVAMRTAKAIPTEASQGTAEVQEPPRQDSQDSPEEPAAAADLQDDSSVTEKTTSTIDVTTDTLTTSTPDSAVQPSAPSVQKASSGGASGQPAKTTPRHVAPAVPVVPVLPKEGAIVNSNPPVSKEQATEKAEDESKPTAEATEQPNEESKPASPVAVSSWSALFKRPSATKPATAGPTPPNGTTVSDKPLPVADGTATVVKSSTTSLADVLKTYEVKSKDKIYFIEPRALKNRGTDCYMNSVLQVLVFCAPFYNFLQQIRSNVVYNFKGTSQTPLIDVMIDFLAEFRAITSADDLDQLRRKLKKEDYQTNGEPFLPDMVYNCIRKLSAFATVWPGSQHDAQEFLMLLLDGLDDECKKTITGPVKAAFGSDDAFSVGDDNNVDSAWTEVGHRQRHAVTTVSGDTPIPNPISKIFDTGFRFELRVPGSKDSIRIEPHKCIPLAIGDPSVKNVVDALKLFTAQETVEMGNAQGAQVIGRMQRSMHILPPVLTLFFKRDKKVGNEFQKIWKSVGYPLELELPPEVLSRQIRNEIAAGGRELPRYKLIGVVYHHGHSVTSGHYTVDVLRQDDQEWIRFDDTQITRISGEDVVAGGAEDTPAKSTGTNKTETGNGPNSNRFAAMEEYDAGDSDGNWKQVGQGANGTKKYSSAVNGTSSGASTPKGKTAKTNFKDNNKVAYVLFYQLLN